MDLTDYQRQAAQTDQRPLTGSSSSGRADAAIVIPLLGIGGELGTLQAAYKKFLRDGEAYQPFRDHIRDELGDILWYVADLATKFDLTLEEVADANLHKLQRRWGALALPRSEEDLLDASAIERLPRTFEVTFSEIATNSAEPMVQVTWQGRPFGDALGDNADGDDGYRFHDVFHLAHAAILGWSPVCRRRKHFDCKRKSDPRTDTVQDGGRAILTEEAIVAYIYGHAREHGYFEHVDAVDFAVLKTIEGLTAGLEVSRVTARQWEKAILDGYRVWRELRANNGGVVIGDLLSGSLTYKA
jgi:NTP pyrophosphatase (non-canonical NTP hydrolase)